MPRCLQATMLATLVLPGVVVLACSRAPRTGRHATGDPQLGAGHRSAGVFNVRASKPGYVSAETSGVTVPGGPRGARARVTVPMTLRPRRFSPRVRSIVIFGTGFGLGPGVYRATATAYVNAARGVDTTVDWRSSNTRAATVDQHGNITSRCLKRKATAIVTATSRADPQKRARTPVDVFGDPTMCAKGDR